MFGAAGAPDLSPSGSMSAQILLSMAAPPAAPPPKGAAAAAPSGFEDLMTGFTEPQAKAAEEQEPVSDEEAAGSLQTIPAPPAALPTPATGPALPATAAAAFVQAVQQATQETPLAGQDAAAPAPEERIEGGAPPGAPAVAAEASDPAPVKDGRTSAAIGSDTGSAANADPEKPADSARTALKTRPHEQALETPVLRALADRTSKPIETAGATAEAPPAAAAAGGETAQAVPRGGPADSGGRSTPDAAAPVQAPPAGTDRAPDEAAPAPERGGASSSEGATEAGRSPAATSGLSRGAVEATAQIAAQILRRLDGRSTRFEMALLPEELGRVDVKLDIDAEGRLAARLAFDNPAAATDLRGRADELRRQLEQAGLHLAEDAFEFAERDSSSGAFDRGQDSGRGSRRAFAAAARLTLETDVAPPLRGLSLSLSPTGVDLKV